MRKSWYETTLGQIAEVQSGSGFPKKYQGEKEGDYPFVKVGDMNLPENQREIVTANNWVRESVRNELRAKVYVTGSIIFPKIGAAIATNKKRLVKLPCCADNNVIGLIPNTNKVLPEFLYYWMLQHDLSEFANDSNPPSMRKSTIEEFGLVITDDLDEQKRIVAILDEAFAGIDTAMANTQKNLANARELFESYLNKVFTKKRDGWEDIKLGEVCVVERGSSPRPIKAYLTDDEDGVNWVKIGDTKGITKYIKTTKQKITQEGALRSRRVEPGDFILTNSMSYGRPYIMATTGYIHDGWFFLRLKEYINTEYFYHLLSSRFVQEQFGILAAGAVVKNISSDLVKKAILPIPPMDQQVEIVAEIEMLSDQVQQLESIYERKLSALTDLKQSLLQKAFSGELTAEDIKPGDEAVA